MSTLILTRPSMDGLWTFISRNRSNSCANSRQDLSLLISPGKFSVVLTRREILDDDN